MKKATPVLAGILLAVMMVVLMVPVSVYAEGINIISENGDSINMFKNVKVDQPVQGNIITVFGNVEINAEVTGQVITVFGSSSINSSVSGQVVTVLGNTDLGAKASINNDMITIGQVTRAPGAKITGQEINMAGRNMSFDIRGLVVARVLLLLVFAIIVFGTGMIYIAAAGNKIKTLEENIEKDPGRKLLLGFLAFTGATIALALLFITILVPVLYLALVVFAFIISSIYLGKLILKIMNAGSRVYLEFVTGLLTITLTELLVTLLIPGEDILISISLLGIISLLINSFGVGTLFIEKFTKR